ncbi:MAG: hypothetical protein KUG81_10240 [Gammaproteobacteria bacterium]|nr:hypothetical protein [Gammaproteobacteria bacterium]
MVKIELEEWQVKNLREYFGHNDKTQTEHWAYDVFNNAYKEQCNIPVVVSMLVCETCKRDFRPIDKYNFHCQMCQPCKPITN